MEREPPADPNPVQGPRECKGVKRILTGQTASGKSAVAVCLAEAVDAELISLDSMKLYRGLDIGTAKPSREIRENVPFHLVDVVGPKDVFSLARYLDAAREAEEQIASRGRRAIYVGGTPLYLRGLIYGIFDGPAADWHLREQLKQRAEMEGSEVLHEELAAVDAKTARRLHPNDTTRIIRALEVATTTGKPISSLQRQYPARRPAVSYRMAALQRSDEDLRRRIARRTRSMFERGLVDEVRRVLAQGGFNRSSEKAIGYREVLALINNKCTLDEAREAVERNTWRLARKQRTWLRSFPGVQWVPVAPDEPPDVTAGRVRRLLFGSANMN